VLDLSRIPTIPHVGGESSASRGYGAMGGYTTPALPVLGGLAPAYAAAGTAGGAVTITANNYTRIDMAEFTFMVQQALREITGN